MRRARRLVDSRRLHHCESSSAATCRRATARPYVLPNGPKYCWAARLLVVLRLVVALAVAGPYGKSDAGKVFRAAYKPLTVFALRGKCVDSEVQLA